MYTVRVLKYLKQSIWVVAFVFLTVFLQGYNNDVNKAVAQGANITISSVSPSSAYPGEVVTIKGSNFFNGLLVVAGNFSVWATYVDNNTITFTVPNPTSYIAGQLTVRDPDDTYQAYYDNFEIVAPTSVPDKDSDCYPNKLCGYAWSENIGWISFASDRNDLSASYGITVGSPDSNGVRTLNGYAWSENIGWIAFGGQDTVTMPGSGSRTNTSIDSINRIYGFARACSVYQTGCSGTLKSTLETGGWDGWIGMSGMIFDPVLGPVQYAPIVDYNNGTIRGWSWGGDVLGWIDFSDVYIYKNTTPTVDLSINGDLSQNQSYTLGDILSFSSNASDPDGSVSKVEFYINDIDYSGGLPISTDNSGPGPFTGQLTTYAAGTYLINAVATDNQGATSSSASISVVVNDAPACSNNRDDDGDGYIDLVDAGCVDASGQSEITECQDNLENDIPSDEVKDDADPGCHSDPSGDYRQDTDEYNSQGSLSVDLKWKMPGSGNNFIDNGFTAGKYSNTDLIFQVNINGGGATTTCSYINLPSGFSNQISAQNSSNYSQSVSHTLYGSKDSPFITTLFKVSCQLERYPDIQASDEIEIKGIDNKEI